MDTPELANQQKLTYISSVRTLDVGLRNCQEPLLIGKDDKRELSETVISSRLDDDDVTKQKHAHYGEVTCGVVKDFGAI